MSEEQAQALYMAVYAAKFAQECGHTSPDAAHARAKHVAEMAVGLMQSDKECSEEWMPK